MKTKKEIKEMKDYLWGIHQAKIVTNPNNPELPQWRFPEKEPRTKEIEEKVETGVKMQGKTEARATAIALMWVLGEYDFYQVL